VAWLEVWCLVKWRAIVGVSVAQVLEELVYGKDRGVVLRLRTVVGPLRVHLVDGAVVPAYQVLLVFVSLDHLDGPEGSSP
jgi:hypothetical protein